MDLHGLSLVYYASLVHEMKPLCPGCLDLDPSIFDWRAVRWATTYPCLNSQKIVAGADGGCMSCALICAAFRSVGLDFCTSYGVLDIGLYNENESGSLIIGATSLQEPNKLVELYTVQDSICSPWSVINTRTHLSGNTASEAGTQRMQRWIEQCIADHGRCSHNNDAPLPTRVIDLGDSNEAIRLLETHNMYGKYICLSHCWGESPTILSTRARYKVFTNNIPWNSLPSLFRDAIEVCRILKVQYLWIDKLCIIQHDKEDWAREGSRMAQIFEGSFLTIAALSSKNDKDPLFFKDEKYAPSQQGHPGLMKDGTAYTVYSRTPLDYHPSDNFQLSTIDECYPLAKRAWVYQERLLSPRILYFGKELGWECREASACECSGMTNGMKYKHSLSLTFTQSTSQLYLQWQNMIEAFSCLCLSHEDDRLPAFSGLAQQFQSRLQSAYLAGLWKDNLTADLLWYAHPALHDKAPRYYTRKPVKWRAPTWSWASVEGPVQYWKSQEDYVLTSFVEIMSAECISSSVDKLGAVSEGRLVVRGSTRPALLSHRDDCERADTQHFSIHNIDTRAYLITNHFKVEGQDANVDYDLIEQGLMEPNSDMSIHCLYIAGAPFEKRTYYQSQREYGYRSTYKMVFLLLRCVVDQIFERIGFLHRDYQDGKEKEVLNCLKENTVTLV